MLLQQQLRVLSLTAQAPEVAVEGVGEGRGEMETMRTSPLHMMSKGFLVVGENGANKTTTMIKFDSNHV